MQVDQLCAAMQTALCGTDQDNFDICEFKDLKPGIYIIYFVDYTDGAAVMAIPNSHLRNGAKKRDIRVSDIPKKLMNNWKPYEVLDTLPDQ